MSIPRLYDDLAWTWEILVSEEEYVPEVNFVKKMINRYKGTSGDLLLDVACGAGHHDLFLKDEYKVVGIDQSAEMLKRARKRNPELEYHLGDMRTFQLNREYDSLLAMDMIMYNLTYPDLEKTLANFSDHLKRGGVMIFFVENLKERFEQNKTRFKEHKKGNVEIVLIENDYDPDPNDTEFECHLIFLIRRDGRLQIEVDRERMGLFELSEVLKILENLSFKTHLYELDFSGREYKREGPLFVCEKVS